MGNQIEWRIVNEEVSLDVAGCGGGGDRFDRVRT